MTQAALVAAARQCFASRGYHATTIEDIVVAAQLTRGALYYHFTDKEDVFRAVIEDVLEEAIASALEPEGSDDAWERATTGMLSYLDACFDPTRARILLIDGPAVFGLMQLVAMSERSLGSVWSQVLEVCMEEGLIERLPVAALGHVIAAAVSEGAIYVMLSEDREAARSDVRVVLRQLMRGFRRVVPDTSAE